MEISNSKNLEVEALSNTIHPTLEFSVPITVQTYFEFPIFCSGHLETEDKKRIASLSATVQRNFDGILALGNSPVSQIQKMVEDITQIDFKLIAILDQLGINYIEDQRQKNPLKDMQLYLSVQFYVLRSEINYKEKVETANHKIVPIIYSKLVTINPTITIPESKWIQKYTEKLGIGKYLLLEMKLPNNKPVNKAWEKEISRAYDRLKKMEKEIKHGEWYDSIETGRKVMELFKYKLLNGKEAPQPKEKEKLRKLFIESHGSDAAFDSFYSTIGGMFGFISKFVHEKDHKDEYFNQPAPKKEDAYFVYAICISLVNLISNKIKE